MILTAIIPRFLAAFGLVIGFGMAENALAQSNPIAPKILEPIEFAAYTVSQINSPSAVSNLLDLKISISPGNDSTGCKILCKGAGNYVETETINQYRAALSAGYSPYTTYDISIESWFKKVDAVLAFMDKAQACTNSLLNKSFLKNLPPLFMDTVGTDERKALADDANKGVTIADYAHGKGSHKATKFVLKDNCVSFESDGCEYFVQVLAKGDINHDGYEDALVMISTSYIGGSGRYYQTFVFTQTSSTQNQLKLVK